MFTDFAEAWHFLEEHPIFEISDKINMFPNQCLSIDVVKVNPATEKIDDNVSLNTATRVWLECGPWEKSESLGEEARQHLPDGCPSHDIELDVGAPTFEEAVVELANLVLKKYGDYPREGK